MCAHMNIHVTTLLTLNFLFCQCCSTFTVIISFYPVEPLSVCACICEYLCICILGCVNACACVCEWSSFYITCTTANSFCTPLTDKAHCMPFDQIAEWPVGFSVCVIPTCFPPTGPWGDHVPQVRLQGRPVERGHHHVPVSDRQGAVRRQHAAAAQGLLRKKRWSQAKVSPSCHPHTPPFIYF